MREIGAQPFIIEWSGTGLVQLKYHLQLSTSMEGFVFDFTLILHVHVCTVAVCQIIVTVTVYLFIWFLVLGCWVTTGVSAQ